MIQVAYVSRASSSLASDEIFNIIETSANNNLRDDLTGFLIFSDNRFFQVVEGSEASIESLLSRLGSDRRHSDIEILSRIEVEERSFPNWRMKRLKPDAQLISSANSGSGIGDFPRHLKHFVEQFLSNSAPSIAAA